MYASRFRTRASIGAGYSIRYSSTGTRAFIRSSLEVEGTARAKTEGSQQVSLARLPKAIPGRFKSLHFRDVTPGSSVKLTNDFFQLHRPTPQKPYPNSDLYLDSTHPIHTYSFKDVPKYESAFLKIRAYPFARLAPHSQSSLPNPYTEEMKTQRRKTQLPMSLIVPMTPYNLHKSGAIRKVVRSRLKEALRLVVVRGARGSGDPDANSAVLDENDASSERWLIKDWTYVIKPTLAIYKSPMPVIVGDIRLGLQSVKTMAETLENKRQTKETTTESRAPKGRSFDQRGSKRNIWR